MRVQSMLVRGAPIRMRAAPFVSLTRVGADGLIPTNAHVVRGAKEATVKLTDRREFQARVAGRDDKTDVAVLKIDAANPPTVPLAARRRLRALHPDRRGGESLKFWRPALQPKNRSWTRSMARLGGCLPRSNEAAGRGLQRGARAESLPLQRLYESGLPFIPFGYLRVQRQAHDQTC